MVEDKIKICRFEFDLLCHYLRQGFKYIARDLDGEVCVFLRKPIKLSVLSGDLEFWSERCNLKNKKFDSLGSISKVYFNFIKWEDEEPVLIEELIKFYELY